MVLSHKIGKERDFGMVLLLLIVTFGIYGIYWNYKAHSEVYKQFELIHEGKDEGVIWLILGLVLFQPLMWVYQAIFVGNVRYVRERLGMTGNVGPGGFLGFIIPGAILGAIGGVLVIVGIQFALAEAGPQSGLSEAEAERLNDMAGALVAIGAPLMLIGWGLQIAGYYRLQSQINEVWRGYDQRMMELRPGASSEAGGQPSVEPWS